MPPNKRRKHMEGLINFLKSCVMLIGTIIIMACSCDNKEKKAAQVAEARAQEIAAGREEALKKFKTSALDFFQTKQGTRFHRFLLKVFYFRPTLYAFLHKLSFWNQRKSFHHGLKND